MEREKASGFFHVLLLFPRSRFSFKTHGKWQVEDMTLWSPDQCGIWPCKLANILRRMTNVTYDQAFFFLVETEESEKLKNA